MTTPERNKNASLSSQNQTKHWLIKFWSTHSGKKRHMQLACTWKKGGCPVVCEVKSNQSRIGEADGFVVHARDPHAIPPNDSVPWILLTQENPVYTPAQTNAEFMSKFKLLRSYRLDSDFPDPSYYMPASTAPLPFKEKNCSSILKLRASAHGIHETADAVCAG